MFPGRQGAGTWLVDLVDLLEHSLARANVPERRVPRTLIRSVPIDAPPPFSYQPNRTPLIPGQMCGKVAYHLGDVG